MKTLMLALPLTLLAPLGLLSACDSSPTVEAKNASVAEVAEKVRDAGGDDLLRAGKWQTKAVLEELEAPGMPAGIADHMKTMMDKKPGTTSCITEADARKPKADFFGGENKNCSYDHFKMGDGKIDAKMRCSAGGQSQLMTMVGDYSPDQYQMRMTTEMDRAAGAAAGAMSSLTMKMRVEGKRIGDCDTKTAAEG